MKKYENFKANLRVLEKAGEEDLANEFIQSGIIDKFFIQFELGWKVLKELLEYEGVRVDHLGSPRSVIKAAYEVWDFLDEEVWLEMLASRNNVAHICDEHAAKELVQNILGTYTKAFQEMETYIDEHYQTALEKNLLY